MAELLGNIKYWFIPTNKIDRDSKTIYVGSTVDGLYVSTDEGETWREAFDTGGYTMSTIEVESSEDITLVSIASKVYKTLDNGETWNEITQLRNKGIVSFCINGNTIFAGLWRNKSGMYVYKKLRRNYGKENSQFGDNEATKIRIFKRTLLRQLNTVLRIISTGCMYHPTLEETWSNSDPNMFSLD
jgi:hypothetical protein